MAGPRTKGGRVNERALDETWLGRRRPGRQETRGAANAGGGAGATDFLLRDPGQG